MMIVMAVLRTVARKVLIPNTRAQSSLDREAAIWKLRSKREKERKAGQFCWQTLRRHQGQREGRFMAQGKGGQPVALQTMKDYSSYDPRPLAMLPGADDSSQS